MHHHRPVPLSLLTDPARNSLQQRKAIVQRIKELQPSVSNRQIARTLGVGGAQSPILPVGGLDFDIQPRGGRIERQHRIDPVILKCRLALLGHVRNPAHQIGKSDPGVPRRQSPRRSRAAASALRNCHAAGRKLQHPSIRSVMRRRRMPWPLALQSAQSAAGWGTVRPR